MTISSLFVPFGFLGVVTALFCPDLHISARAARWIHMVRRLDEEGLRFADADGEALALEARVALKSLWRFKDARRNTSAAAATTSTFADAIALEHADPIAAFKVDPKVSTDRVQPVFEAYLDNRTGVLAPDLLLRAGLDVNDATPHNELGKAAVIVDMFARCYPALEFVYYRAHAKAPRQPFDFPSPLRQVLFFLSTPHAVCSVAVTYERPSPPRPPRPPRHVRALSAQRDLRPDRPSSRAQ